MKIYQVLCLFILAINSCHTKKSDYTSEEFILSQKTLTNGFIKYSRDKYLYLSDHIKGDIGNQFKFDSIGNLSTYSFQLNSGELSYLESFDSINHNIVSIDGSPIVYKLIDVDRNPDSIYTQYLITDFSYNNIKFSISDNGKSFMNVPIKKYPKLVFIESVDFVKNIKGSKRFYLIGKFVGSLKKSNVVKTYYDTIDLSKR